MIDDLAHTKVKPRQLISTNGKQQFLASALSYLQAVLIDFHLSVWYHTSSHFPRVVVGGVKCNSVDFPVEFPAIAVRNPNDPLIWIFIPFIGSVSLLTFHLSIPVIHVFICLSIPLPWCVLPPVAQSHPDFDARLFPRRPMAPMSLNPTDRRRDMQHSDIVQLPPRMARKDAFSPGGTGRHVPTGRK